MIDRPKPALSLNAVERVGGSETRRTYALFDGGQSWFFDDGLSRELVTPGSAVRVRDISVERGAKPHGDHSWIVDLIEPRRMAYLGDADGFIVGKTIIAGRSCWDVQCEGLRRNEPNTNFRLSVDETTGSVLQLSRVGMDAIVEVLEIHMAQ